MAKKKQEPGTELSTFSAADFEAMLASGMMKESAQALVAAEPVFGSRNILRMKGGDFYLGDNKLPKPLPVVMLSASFAQMFYTEAYDPDNKMPPVCFALSMDKDTMAHDPTSPEPQFEGPCELCPQNMPRSAGDGSWARACSGRRRVAFLFADDKSDDPQVGSMEISASGLAPFTAHLKGIAAIHHAPMYMFVTLLDTELSRKGQGSPFIVPKLGENLARAQPRWLMGDKETKLGSHEWLVSTLIGRKLAEVAESKMLLAPPSLVAPEKPAGKKPVTGAKRVSVKDAKAARKAKK